MAAYVLAYQPDVIAYQPDVIAWHLGVTVWRLDVIAHHRGVIAWRPPELLRVGEATLKKMRMRWLGALSGYRLAWQ